MWVCSMLATYMSPLFYMPSIYFTHTSQMGTCVFQSFGSIKLPSSANNDKLPMTCIYNDKQDSSHILASVCEILDMSDIPSHSVSFKIIVIVHVRAPPCM